MVSRMTAAKTATFLQVGSHFPLNILHLLTSRDLPQSLVIPFAFLIYNQRDTVLLLLESTNIQGHSGLDILIHTWCENAETFQGFWPTRISNLALSGLFT